MAETEIKARIDESRARMQKFYGKLINQNEYAVQCDYIDGLTAIRGMFTIDKDLLERIKSYESN
jgi:hypothetical protein